MSDDPTHALVKEPLAGRVADTTETAGGRDLAASMVGVAFAALRHEVEASDASARAQSRARASLRSLVARFDDAPHAADRLISELGPTPREVTLAREDPDAMSVLAEARAHAVAMMVESGITSVRGQLDFAIAARMRTIADAMLDDPSRAAAAADMLTKAASLQDRAVDADARIRTQQRKQRQFDEWERKRAIVDAEPLQSVDVDTSELDAPDPIERAQATITGLIARKIQAGVAFLNPRDDSIRIKPPSTPHPSAAKALAKAARSAKGTSPLTDGRDTPRRKMTADEMAARGLFSDTSFDANPHAIAEAERQAAVRAERESEFEGGIGRLTGRVGKWLPKPRPEEPAPHEQLARLKQGDKP